MRIRNRKVPFPLSSLSPVPLSDPVVQLQHNRYEEDDTDEYFDPKPSDQYSKEPIRAVDGGAQLEKQVLEVNKSGEEGEKSNDSRKDSLLGAEILGNMAVQQTSSPSQPVTGKWFEGERAFPLKRKRGSNEKRSSVKEEAKMEKDKKVKTKVNKKCNVEKEAKVQGEEEEESKEGSETAITSASSSAKRKGRGGALMEGSRCSRVNGRGWRCCQQTLVGYSLCEHHLGKGRLRSMNSVRKRSLGTNNGGTLGKKDDKSSSQKSSRPSLSLQEKEMKLNIALDHQADNDAQEDENDQEEKLLMVNNAKKKTKLGVVKARSISSLLGQANNAGIAVAADSNE